MSKFSVEVVKVDAIEPIEGADMIELAKIADYRSVVKKGQFKKGDLAVYIPEGAVVPEWLLIHMNLVGKLTGSAKNRVKCCRLRNCLSQGLLLDTEKFNKHEVLVIHPPHDGNQGSGVYKLGDDVANDLGIIKYEPQVPLHMAGECCGIGSENTINYDIENLKRYPSVFKEQIVSVREKLHGSFCMLGYVPDLNNHELYGRNKFAASKGLGAKGLVMKNNERNQNNLYVKAFRSLDVDGSDIFTHLENIFSTDSASDGLKELLEKPVHIVEIEESRPGRRTSYFYQMQCPIYFLGEVFGRGVQDLTYGTTEPKFRLFDVYLGKPTQGRYLNNDEKKLLAKELNIDMVPELYVGPYNREKMDELVGGKTTIEGGTNIREGIVITPVIEERNNEIGRVILKHISSEYLLRKDPNATEFQ